MAEKQEVSDLLEKNEEEIGAIIDMYNEYKEILDQHRLTEDLEELLA
jgi:hypothetical protein